MRPERLQLRVVALVETSSIKAARQMWSQRAPYHENPGFHTNDLGVVRVVEPDLVVTHLMAL